MNVAMEKKLGSTWIAVLLLLSVLCFVGLVVLQVMEWQTYGGESSVWPS